MFQRFKIWYLSGCDRSKAHQIMTIMFLCSLAFVTNGLEIEAEGQYGWAEKMPTWFRTEGFVPQIYGLFLSGKPLTGYHMYMFFLPILIFHSHFAMGVRWTPSREIMTWAMYFAWCPLMDYGWFVLNPHYAGKWSQDQIWWHAQAWWIGGVMPFDYAFSLVGSLGLALLAAYVRGSGLLFRRHLRMLCGFAVYLVLLHFAAPLYHAWYWQMREHDERDQAGIFHR